MRFVNALAAAALGLAALSPQFVSAQERIENPEGTWQHRGSGSVFPRFLGSAERRSITEFDDQGADAGIGYSMTTPDGVLILTIYVYPVIEDFTCRDTYDDAKRAIDAYPGAEVLSETRLASPGGTRNDAAYFARYYIPEGSMKPDYPELISDLYLYCPANSEWLVKYRATWNGEINAFPDVAPMLKQIGWGKGLE